MRKTSKPRTTPQLHLSREEAIPLTHRLGIERAMYQCDTALTELTKVCMAYDPRDPRAADVRRLATWLDAVLFHGQTFLASHPGVEGRATS